MPRNSMTIKWMQLKLNLWLEIDLIDYKLSGWCCQYDHWKLADLHCRIVHAEVLLALVLQVWDLTEQEGPAKYKIVGLYIENYLCFIVCPGHLLTIYFTIIAVYDFFVSHRMSPLVEVLERAWECGEETGRRLARGSCNTWGRELQVCKNSSY